MEEKERVRELAQRLMDRLEQAVGELDAVMEKHREKRKTEDGEETVEYERRNGKRRGIVDRGGLKQLTGVLRELQEVLLCDPEAESRERLLRLEKLEKELNRTETDTGITVILEGGAEQYAD